MINIFLFVQYQYLDNDFLSICVYLPKSLLSFYLKEELQFKKDCAVLLNCASLDKKNSSALF